MSYDSGTPLPVENPERFYRSGENRKGLIAVEQSVLSGLLVSFISLKIFQEFRIGRQDQRTLFIHGLFIDF
jgi:hypothetical protein